MKRHLYVISIFLQITFLLHAQNLVRNPGFEIYTDCPNNYNTTLGEELVPGWTIPAAGTSDYFNSCDHSNRAGVPANRMGYMEAKEGNAYAGIILSGEVSNENKNQNKNYREYLQNHLQQPLIQNKTYCVKFNYCIASNSLYSVNKLGVYFSGKQLKSDKKLLSYKPQCTKDTLILDRNKDKWLEFCATYRATGGEEYFTIGNFSTDANTLFHTFEQRELNSNHAQNQRIVNFAYYYIDNVSVTEIADGFNCCPRNKDRQYFPRTTNVQPGMTYILENIYFNFDKFTLNKKSYATLDKLLELLVANSTWKIEISGHTDSIGSTDYNQKLSFMRANAVAQYLLENTIYPERVIFKGYGFNMPLVSNNTAKGRETNRRVEFRLID